MAEKPKRSRVTVTVAEPERSRSPLAPPVGMRDLLPPEAAERRALVRRLVERFGRHGYSLVTTPPFEHADVFERAEGTFDPRDHLRFVDADTGDVALLRPDITPQIARVVATRLGDRPPPIRLAYDGHVVRRRRGRARRQRQIGQCGIECIGVPGTEGDVEVIALLAHALDDAGLEAYAIELALVPLVRSELARVPVDRRGDATEALARKDRASLATTLRSAPARTRETLAAACELVGDVAVLRDAERVFGAPGASALLASLTALATRLERMGLGPRLLFDLGEVRGFGYYTGPSFSVLAPGPGEPIGGGGRYDGLLAAFGRDLPGAGFALDIDHLGWALRAAGHVTPAGELPLLALAGAPDDETLALLRASGVAVATIGGLDDGAAVAWADAWGARFVGRATGARFVATDRAGGAEARFSGSTSEGARWLGARRLPAASKAQKKRTKAARPSATRNSLGVERGSA